jgi:hypothetical protein
MKERGSGEGEATFLHMEVLVLSVQASGHVRTSADNLAPQVGHSNVQLVASRYFSQ